MTNYLLINGKSDEDIIKLLFEHMAKNNFAGLDPSSVIYNPRLIKILDSTKGSKWINRLFKYSIYKIIYYMGHRTNKLLRPIELQFSKGIALTLSALAHLLQKSIFEAEKKSNYVKKLSSLLERKRLGDYFLWAHDINYLVQDVEITTNTPNLVTTSFVAKCYWHLWISTQDILYLTLFTNILDDMIRLFPYKEYNNDLCFMYTPITNYHVHNANLLMAELLARYYSVNNDNNLYNLALKSVRYSIHDFERTNSLPYAGPPTENKIVDNYHTGYVLRSLHSIKKYLPSFIEKFKIDEHLKKGIKIYINNFVDRNKIWQGDRLLETHSLAESILFLKEFKSYLSSTEQHTILEAIRSTSERLWDYDRNIFVNNIKCLPNGIEFIRDKSDMIRWSQAWMLFALAYDPLKK